MMTLAVAVVLAFMPSVAAAAGWTLVLSLVSITGHTIAISPTPYATTQACEQAGQVWQARNTVNHSFVCIPAP